jgi:hypothetical protein
MRVHRRLFRPTETRLGVGSTKLDNLFEAKQGAA